MRFNSPHSSPSQPTGDHSGADATESLRLTAHAEVDVPASAQVMLDSQAELPDHLFALAEQLGEDALHLSALYPAGNPDVWKQQSQQQLADATRLASERSGSPLRRRFALWAKGAMVAASLLVAATLAWRSLPQANVAESLPATPTASKAVPPNDSLAISPLTDLEVSDSAASNTEIASNKATDSNRIIGTPQVESSMVPAGLFLTLSGPEQEAMLDLIEDAKLQQPSVSF